MWQSVIWYLPIYLELPRILSLETIGPKFGKLGLDGLFLPHTDEPCSIRVEGTDNQDNFILNTPCWRQNMAEYAMMFPC
jgi:hypothetical protein